MPCRAHCELSTTSGGDVYTIGMAFEWYIFLPHVDELTFTQVKKTPIIKAKPLKLDYNSRLKKKYGR